MATKIRSIELNHFRVHEAVKLDLAERNLVIGENGTGKSSLVDAIAWCLTGRCRGVDGRGKGQLELIQTGAAETSVTLDLAGIGTITRQFGRDGSSQSSMKTEAILAKLKTSEAMVHAVLYAGSFFSMHHADAKALLMGLLNVRVKAADLPGLGVDPDGDGLDLDELAARYKAAFDLRTGLKRTVAAAKLPAPPTITEDQMAAWGGKDAKALKALAEEAGRQFQAAAKVQATAMAELTAAKKEAAAAEARPVVDRAALDEQLNVHEAQLIEHTAAMNRAKDALLVVEAKAEPVDQLKLELADMKALKERLDKHQPGAGCVLAGDIPCHTMASEFEGYLAKTGKVIKGLTTKITKAEGAADALGKAKAAVKASEHQVAFHQGQIGQTKIKIENLDDLLAKQDAALAAANERLAAAEADPDLANGPVDTAAAYMHRTNQEAVDAARYQGAVEQFQKAQADHEQLLKELAEAERVVALLGPKGAPAKALQAALAEFTGLINAALEQFGFQLRITVDPFLVEVQSQRATWRPFTMLSAGEQLWTGLAFQLALAIVSGLEFCAIDAAEAVVGVNREVLTNLVMGAPVDQVLVAMAKGAAEDSPVIDGLHVIRLEQEAVTT